jgi:hypothetical protein
MVQVNTEMSRKLGLVENDGTMTAFDFKVLGCKEVRIGVPLVSRYDLRVVADCLRGLATILDVESRRQDVPERASLFRALCEVNSINHRIRDHYEEVYRRLGIPQPKRGGRPRADGEI